MLQQSCFPSAPGGRWVQNPPPPDPDCFNPAGLAAVPKSVLNPLLSLSSNFADGTDALPSILQIFFPKMLLFWLLHVKAREFNSLISTPRSSL